MTSIATVLRLSRVLRATARRRLALVLFAAMAAVLADAPAGRADGPLTLVTSVPLGFRAHDIILDGNFAYVATERGLTIFDISNPVQPVVRGSEPSINAGRCQGLAKKGSYVYLAASKGGMQVIDVSNPDDPQTIARAWQGGIIYDVAVHPTANAAYSISYSGLLYVWDISNPAVPTLRQTLGIRQWRGFCEPCMEAMRNLSPKGAARTVGVSAAGNNVFAAEWNYGGLYAWNSSDPFHLTFTGTYRAPVSFRAEADVARDVVYVLGTYSKGSGVHTVPLSMLDPFVEIHPDTCDPCDFEPSISMDGGGIGFSSNGKYVFYAGGRGYGEIHIINATDPSNLLSVAKMPLGRHYLKIAQGEGIVSRGDYLYVAASLLGLQVYKFPGLSSP